MQKNFFSFLFSLGLVTSGFAQSILPNTPIEPPPVPTVLMSGLGVSFDSTKEMVSAMGFKSQDAIARPGEYSRFEPGSTFPLQFVNFTAITGKLYSIMGVKFYKTENGIADVAKACLHDLYLMDDTLKEKYPALVNVNSYLPSLGKAKQLCESKAAFLVAGKREETGYQRCVSVSCESTNTELSRLTISYSDQNLLRLSWDESKTLFNKTIEQRKQRSGINKEEL